MARLVGNFVLILVPLTLSLTNKKGPCVPDEHLKSILNLTKHCQRF